jgi:hypothetical protein
LKLTKNHIEASIATAWSVCRNLIDLQPVLEVSLQSNKISQDISNCLRSLKNRLSTTIEDFLATIEVSSNEHLEFAECPIKGFSSRAMEDSLHIHMKHT